MSSITIIKRLNYELHSQVKNDVHISLKKAQKALL